MKLSVIILNYNVQYFLEQCLYSVRKALQNIDSEIIVADNASSDGSCQMVKEKFPDIVLIENATNFGFPKGNNIGVNHAKGEFICILNPDTVVAEDTFLQLFNFKNQQSISNIGIIGTKLIDGAGCFLPESKRGVPTPWVAFTKIFGLYKWFPKSKLFNQYYAQHLSENQTGEVDILVGAFMFLKKELYQKVGGFDENCFMYSDDIDLSYMIKKLGYQNYYFAEASVIHYKGESTVRDSKYIKRFSEAMQFFYQKHFKKSYFFDVFMKAGTFFFTLFKKQQQKNTERKIDEYIVFTKQKLEFNFSKSINYQAELNCFKNDNSKNIEIIFDTKSFSFLEIINFMQFHKSKNITFKNYIFQSNYLIGSNNANDLGKVLKLS